MAPPPAESTSPAARESQAADVVHAARGGLVQILSAAGQALMPVCQVLIVRLFGLGAFGVYQATLAAVDVLTRLALLGTPGGQHRFIARHRAAGERELELRALGTALRLVVGLAVVLAAGLSLFAPLVARATHDPELVVTLPRMAPSILFTGLTMMLVAATLGAKVVRMSLYVRGLAEPALLLAACAGAWALGGGVRRLALAHAVATGLTAGLAIVAAARVFGARRLLRALAAPAHPSLMRFAIPLGVTDLLNAVLQRADTFIITYFAGVDALAVYAAAEYMTRIIVNARYAFDPIAAPIFAEAMQAGDRPRTRYNLALMTRWVTLGAAPVAASMIALRHEILDLYGPSFSTGGTVLIILAASQLVTAGLGLTPYVLSMGGRSRLLLVNSLGAAGLNVGLGIVLVPRLGIAGAALAVWISVTALHVALTLETWILEGVHPFAPALAKPALAAAVALVVQTAVRGWLPHGTALRIVAVMAAGTLSYVAVLLALGPAAEERRLLASLRRGRPSS